MSVRSSSSFKETQKNRRDWNVAQWPRTFCMGHWYGTSKTIQLILWRERTFLQHFNKILKTSNTQHCATLTLALDQKPAKCEGANSQAGNVSALTMSWITHPTLCPNWTWFKWMSATESVELHVWMCYLLGVTQHKILALMPCFYFSLLKTGHEQRGICQGAGRIFFVFLTFLTQQNLFIC